MGLQDLGFPYCAVCGEIVFTCLNNLANPPYYQAECSCRILQARTKEELIKKVEREKQCENQK